MPCNNRVERLLVVVYKQYVVAMIAMSVANRSLPTRSCPRVLLWHVIELSDPIKTPPPYVRAHTQILQPKCSNSTAESAVP